MNEETANIFQIHLAVLLFGIGSLFGKLISLEPTLIIFGRSVFAIIALFLIIKITKEKLHLDTKKEYLELLTLGIILAIHWVTFVESVQISSVAIGLITYSTFPFFVLFFEGIFFKMKMKQVNIILASLVFLGVVLILPNYEFSSSTTLGAIYGIISAITFALLAIMNKKYVQKYSGFKVVFYEAIGVVLILTPIALSSNIEIGNTNLILIFLFGVVFTAISHSLFIFGMKRTSTQKASIIGTLELIYGVIGAIIVLGEFPQIRTIFGSLIIIAATAYATINAKTEAKQEFKDRV